MKVSGGTFEKADYEVYTGMKNLLHNGRFRLVVFRLELGNWRRGCQFIKACVDEFGWWPVIYGMDFWIQGVPLIRTTIAVNIVVWILMWIALR